MIFKQISESKKRRRFENEWNLNASDSPPDIGRTAGAELVAFNTIPNRKKPPRASHSAFDEAEIINGDGLIALIGRVFNT